MKQIINTLTALLLVISGSILVITGRAERAQAAENADTPPDGTWVVTGYTDESGTVCDESVCFNSRDSFEISGGCGKYNMCNCCECISVDVRFVGNGTSYDIVYGENIKLGTAEVARDVMTVRLNDSGDNGAYIYKRQDPLKQKRG